jgi:hypothetical protein
VAWEITRAKQPDVKLRLAAVKLARGERDGDWSPQCPDIVGNQLSIDRLIERRAPLMG